MIFPDPLPGMVVCYSYLWTDEYREGLEEGAKDRPCVILSCHPAPDGGKRVRVLPVTHSPPQNGRHAVEIPAQTKARLGMDSGRSWIVCTEVNQFDWPGHDLRATHRGGKKCDYGVIPPGLFASARDCTAANIKTRNFTVVPRTDALTP